MRTKISNQSHIDDLSQDIWLRVIRNFGSLSSEEKIKPWLFQIARNAITDYYRARGKIAEGFDMDALIAPEHELAVSAELSRCILPFIKELPEQESQLLEAIEIDGISQKVYAEQHGINYSTLKSRVQKSRQSLRAVFEQCCTFSFDAGGNVEDFYRKSASCKKC